MIRSYSAYSLRKLHTFGTWVTAKFYFEFTETEDLQGFMASNNEWRLYPVQILGKGSNLLFIDDFPGLILNPNIPGIKIAYEDRNHIWLEAGAGVIWDNLVEYAVSNRWGGIENLSLVPGSVGASVVQNIGAYGVEVFSHVESVSGIDLLTQNEFSFSAAECQFGYRESVFKKNFKNRFLVTSVVFKLEKFPEFVLGYGDLKTETEKFGQVNLPNIRRAVIKIRQSKLPDPAVIGNAGSFFKNPVIEAPVAQKLQLEYPDIPVYPTTSGAVKLAAGWLIDQCGWKGFRRGDAGVHEKQALVLVNYGNATGREIYELSEEIQQSVFEKFGVNLEREVEVIGHFT